MTVVVVHRRRPGALVQTIESLRSQWDGLRVMVVDNASPPADIDVLEALDGVELLRVPVNIGFGPAANVGLRRWLAGGVGEWCLVCPHDAIVEPGCLKHLLTTVESVPGAGLASAEYAEVGQYGQTGDHVKPAVHRFVGTYLAPSEVDFGWEDAAHPHGTMMVLRRSCLEQIGLFDERYFAYSEEADLGFRAIDAGWRVGVVWGAVVRNAEMTSEVGVPEYLMQRNTLMLVRDHYGWVSATVVLGLSLWNCVLGSLVPSKQPLYWHRAGRWLGLWDFVLGRTGPANPRLIPAK